MAAGAACGMRGGQEKNCPCPIWDLTPVFLVFDFLEKSQAKEYG